MRKGLIIPLLFFSLSTIGYFVDTQMLYFEESPFSIDKAENNANSLNSLLKSSFNIPEFLEFEPILRMKKTSEINESFEEKLDLINPISSSENLTGASIRIAIIDSGLNDTNWINPSKIVNRSSVVPNTTIYDNIGHGSAITSIIAKIAPNAEIISIKVTDSSGEIKQGWVEEALQLAQTFNVSIIHASLGSPNITAISQDLINEITGKNTSLVFSAGNSGPYAGSIGSPAVFTESIAVGMAYNHTSIPYSTSVGPRPSGTIGPDILAPGILIPSYENADKEVEVSGTSFASPFVTGAIALLQEAFPMSSPAILKAALLDTAHFINTSTPIQQGNGFINVKKAFQRLQDLQTIPILTFAPKSISSTFRYFGQSINGLNRVYRLGLYSSINCTLTVNASGVLPIEANLTNEISLIKPGYNSLNLSVLIPKNLPMESRSGNISFSFTQIEENQTNTFETNFSIEISNRYPGGRVLFFQGYDNDSFIPDGPTGTFNHLRFLLEYFYGIQVTGAIRSTQGISITDPLVETQNPQGSITAQDLANYDILVLADIEYTISAQEIEIIQNWVNDGHSLLILSYPSQLSAQTELLSNSNAINQLLLPYGMVIQDDDTKPAFSYYKNATITSEAPMFDSNEYIFDYNGTSVGITVRGNSSVLAKAESLENSDEVNIAAYWEDSNSKGKVVVFGGLEPFSDKSFVSSNFISNIVVTSRIFQWLISNQKIPLDLILTSSPTPGSSTQIQITVLEESYIESSFNGTIIEANGSYTQVRFKRSFNTYVGEWIPKKEGEAVLWLDLELTGYSSTNGVYLLIVYATGTQNFFFIILLGGLIIIAIGYYWVSSRRMKSQIPIQDQLALRYKKQQSKVGSKTLEVKEICPRCQTHRHNQNSKYCFKCGREL
jgi:hypothetical protein